jgi:hypothetical protein
MIYFVRAGETGSVKIGKANDVAKRVAGIQVGCPQKLAVLRVCDGDGRVEKFFHKKFAHLRQSGEWFTFSDEMLTAEYEAPAPHEAPAAPVSKAVGFAAVLLERIENYCKETGMTERHFGLEVVKNHKFTSRIRQGYGLHSSTVDRAIALIEGRPLPAPSHKGVQA